MKLSMWTLLGWLQRSGMDASAMISDGNPCVSRLKLLNYPEDGGSGQTDDAAACIYPVQPADGGPLVEIRNGDDRIRLPGGDCAAVCNELTQALEFYNNWERQLLTALLDERSIQELLDIANTVFRRPMFIKNTGNLTFAITDGYDDTIHPHWRSMRESVRTHRSSMEPVRALSTDPEFKKAFQLRYPAVQQHSPSYGGPVLHANVWLKGHRLCEVVALENGQPFDPGDPHLMRLFVSIMERFMAANPNYYLSLTNISALLVNILERREHDTAVCSSLREAASWADEDDLAVISFEVNTGGETPVGGVLQEQLMNELWFGCVFTYKERIVCIANLTKGGGRAACINLLDRIVPKDMFVWAMSYEFTDLELLPLYYRQSLLVLARAMEAGVPHRTMHQVAFDVIHGQLEEVAEFQTFIHPDIHKLMRTDQQNSSQYLQTLFAFLLCGGNYTDAGRLLGLHRNTLIYRISHIEETISADLNDMNDRQQLFISFLLLGKTEL